MALKNQNDLLFGTKIKNNKTIINSTNLIKISLIESRGGDIIKEN